MIPCLCPCLNRPESHCFPISVHIKSGLYHGFSAACKLPTETWEVLLVKYLPLLVNLDAKGSV